MSKKPMLLGVTAVAMTMAMAGIASADAWEMVAGGCVPEHDAIQNNLYSTPSDGSYVAFDPYETGTIRVVCPVTSVNGDPDTIEMLTSGDGDGGSSYYMKAELKKMSKLNGTVSTQCSTTSNTSAFGENNAYCGSLTPNLNRYWVVVTIVRPGTSYSPRFYGVSLE